MVSQLSVEDMQGLLQRFEEAKDKLLCSLQVSIKQIHNYASEHPSEHGFTELIPEVYQLCDCLDRSLLHGLRQFPHGYWPFVKEFTPKGTIKFLHQLKGGLSLSRIWLCLAINEGTLESYLRSFLQHQHILEKYYVRLALLRDEQRMQLLLTLVSGFEYIMFNINLDGPFMNTRLVRSVSQPKEMDTLSNSSISQESQSSVLSPVSIKSFLEEDSGVICAENGIEINSDKDLSIVLEEEISSSLISTPKKANKCLDKHSSSSTPKTGSSELIENSRYVENNTLDDPPSHEDLEVIHTKVVRRCRKSSIKKSNSTGKNFIFNENTRNQHNDLIEVQDTESINNQNRLSKATTDSGISLEMHSSSDSDQNDANDDTRTKRLSFEISDFCHDLDFTFTRPNRDEQCCANQPTQSPISIEMASIVSETVSKTSPTEQDLSEIVDQLESNKIAQPEDGQEPMPSVEGVETAEEVISIYDIAQWRRKSAAKEICCTMEDVRVNCDESVIHSDEEETVSVQENIPQCQKMLAVIDPVAEELSKLPPKEEEMNLKVDSGTHLYLVVKIFEHEEEKLYKVFSVTLRHTQGRKQPAFIVITSRCLHLLRPGDNNEKFYKEASFPFKQIDFISVSLNYQSFTMFCKKVRKQYCVCTGNELLTRSILSSLELSMRRSDLKPLLPSISTAALNQIFSLRRFLVKELGFKAETSVEIKHYVLVQWQDHMANSIASPATTPAGPLYQGFLMYRKRVYKNNSITAWRPAFFLLKGGVLYCMESADDKDPIFFVQLCLPHCKGCRHLHLNNRPYVFEVILENLDSLQLAAADSLEATKWLQAILESVSLAGHFRDTEQKDLIPCCLVLANERIFTLLEDLKTGHIKLLGSANVADLLSVGVNEDMPKCCVLEFEMGEASKCGGDWILFFAAEHEKEKFLDIVCKIWTDIFQMELQVNPLTDLCVREKCRDMDSDLSQSEQSMLSVCYDSD